MFINKIIFTILIVIICVSLLEGQQKPMKKYKGPIDSWPEWEVGKFIYPKILIPDSLGGEKLKGFINYLVYVCKAGDKVGFEITDIYLTKSTKKNVKQFNYMRPTREGDSLLALYTPWVKTYYDSLKFIVKKNSRSFSQQDTGATLQTIIFDREKTNVLTMPKKK